MSAHDNKIKTAIDDIVYCSGITFNLGLSEIMLEYYL